MIKMTKKNTNNDLR